MTCKWLAVVLPLFLALAPTVEAGGTEGKVGAADVARASKDLMEKIDWNDDMDQAFLQAQKTGKPVLWVQMVGDLDGGL